MTPLAEILYKLEFSYCMSEADRQEAVNLVRLVDRNAWDRGYSEGYDEGLQDGEQDCC